MAEEIIKEDNPEEEDTQKGKYMTFKSGHEYFGIEIRYINEIIGMQSITAIPEVEPYIKGLINLRGKIIPVIDVRIRFNQEPFQYTDRTCIIIINVKSTVVGLIVETIAGVEQIDESDIEPPPTISTGSTKNKYVYGLGKTGNSVKLLLDPEKLIKDEDIAAFEEMTEQQAREQILEMTKEYCEKYHNQKKPYEKGDRIPYASRVYDADEMVNLVDSSLEFWLTSGRFTKEFESEFAKYLGVKYCSLVNSGSSANLLAFMALTSPLLKERQILPGDEVITVAAGFPTTVAPVIQYGAVPVFVDVAIPQYNIDPNLLEQAVSEKTKAVMLAHTLGNPFDLKAVKDFCDRHNLWLIEDNCDALGSRYTIDGESRLTGTIGDIGTSSFYPPHHMTMGEGGAVYTKNPLLHKIVRSFRDWGRDCVCAPGQDNLCGHRFDRQYGELPLGYDHKYVYSHFGYNLKATDMQAAVGCAQLRKFPSFVERRIHNFNYLKEALKGTEDKLILPEACENSEPSWFGFLITCREGVDRNQLVQKIEEKGVQTRMLFAGNLIKHPCFDQMRATGKGYRVAGSLENTDRIMTDTFWIGVYPGMTDAMLDAMADAIKEALE